MSEMTWDRVRDLVAAGYLKNATITEARSEGEVSGPIMASGSGFDASGFTVRWTQTKPANGYRGPRTTTFSGWKVEKVSDEDGGLLGFKIIRQRPNPPSGFDHPWPSANEYHVFFAEKRLSL